MQKTGNAGVHSLYQDLFITDLKGEIAQNGNEIEEIRQQLKTKAKENDCLRKENQELKNIVGKYRKMTIELNSTNNNNNNYQHQRTYSIQGTLLNSNGGDGSEPNRDKHLRKRGGITTLIHSLASQKTTTSTAVVQGDNKQRTTSIQLNQMIQHTKNNSICNYGDATESLDELTFNSIKTILKSTKMRQLFLNAKSALKKILSCSQVSFLLRDGEMINYFKNEKGLVQTITIEQGKK